MVFEIRDMFALTQNLQTLETLGRHLRLLERPLGCLGMAYLLMMESDPCVSLFTQVKIVEFIKESHLKAQRLVNFKKHLQS